MDKLNRKFVLKQRPYGEPDANTWSLEESALPSLQSGEFVMEIHFVSLDPAMRGWMDNQRSYIPPVQIGEVMRAGTIGKVVKSENNKFKVGDWIVGWHGVQELAISDGKNDFNLGPQLAVAPEKFLSVLGMPGFTAYFGLFEVGEPKKDETIVVSAAAGAVGSVVGQLAKLKGLKVVGIAGGKEKCDYVVNELGFDACVDYKSMSFPKEMLDATSEGVDIFFDNVGGDILDFMLTRINRNARVVICGAISQYNNEGAVEGPSNYLSLLVNRARMEGFVILDYVDKYPQASMELASWLSQGQIKSREHIEKGIENFPETFKRLFSGDKKGKLVLQMIHD